MAKFIEVTNFENEKLIVNVDNILWFEKSDKENSVIYMASRGTNNFPVSLYVKESIDTLMASVVLM